ncbi:K(+)-insensitive pyrophosphate-energized proton pump [Coccomyxa sp. Obi]|nr:K(+)-insensitive pyrophosphate-energized proton pump [Coccomyxa sp. Obi]
MASVRPNTGSTGDLLRLRVTDPMDLESGAGANPTLSRAFPAKRTPSSSALAKVDPKVLYIAAVIFGLAVLYMGAHTSLVGVFVLVTCFGMLIFAGWLAQWVMAKDEGTVDMQEVSEAIREGAEGFFATQYGVISKLAILVSAVICAIYLFRIQTPEQEKAGLTRTTLALLTAASFLLGAVCSGVAGYVGMWVSVRANVRVSGAARRSAREALQIALRAGGFSALVVLGMTVLGITILYSTFSYFFVGGKGGMAAADIPLLLVGYGFGASFVALFAQLGGGIYTKAADVGADLVGKVEQNIPEDDPRNPAVIADLVGDNVGDCAARGADLFESIAAEVISAMILGGTMAKKAGIEDASGFIMFPLVVHTMDLVVSAAGILSVGSKSSAKPNQAIEDPYDVIKGGYKVAVLLSIAAFIASCRLLLYSAVAPAAWMHFAGCGMVGIANAYAFVWIAQYYTDYKFKPVRVIAEASTTGHATNIIAGVGLGLESTALPVLVMSAALIASYWLGNTSGLTESNADGLFGTAVATMGMLSTAAYVLTMDVFGPISDNAGGIVEMSQQPDSVREITDLLDAVGNTTKATTKGYAIGSAGLASFLLFTAFLDEVATFSGQPFDQVDIATPEVFIGGLLGAMLVFLFSAWAVIAVGRSAQAVVNEVRRQFQERPGIMTYAEKPDYARCVSIVATSALKEMIRPGLLAVLAPCAVGLGFRVLGFYTGQALLGAKAVAGLLMFSMVAGILMALFLNTAGGAWDNAKKYIESGAHGGKGSDAHKAAVTGDTVGDPFKDTAGPSLHVLIKMIATISLVMAPLFLD